MNHLGFKYKIYVKGFRISSPFMAWLLTDVGIDNFDAYIDSPHEDIIYFRYEKDAIMAKLKFAS